MSQERPGGEEMQTGTPPAGSSGPEAHADAPSDEEVCGTPEADMEQEEDGGDKEEASGVVKKSCEESRSLSRAEVVEFLCRLAGQVAGGAVKVGNITVDMPDAIQVEFEYEEEDGKRELEIELKWSG
ncbi:MAG: amphi-Trp domain-containing protein [Desulfotomaculales bacterium]